MPHTTFFISLLKRTHISAFIFGNDLSQRSMGSYIRDRERCLTPTIENTS